MKQIVKHIRTDWVKYGFETLAILVGILGAQYLSNLNEKRLEREIEQEYLVNLLEMLHEPPYLVDSIYVVSKAVFEDLKYSGHLSSISDQDFRYQLAKFYQRTAYAEAVISNNNESFADKLSQDVVQMGVADYGINKEFSLHLAYDFSVNVKPFTGSQKLIAKVLNDDQIRFRVHNMLTFRGRVCSLQHRMLTELLEENRRMIDLLREIL